MDMHLPKTDPEVLLPTRPGPIVDRTLMAPLLAAACCLVAALSVYPENELPSGDAHHAMSCSQRALPAPAVGTELVLLNSSAQDLPAGTAWVWHDRGSPHGVAERRVLPRALARGESLSVQSTQVAYGNGCGARWLAAELRPELAAPR